MQLTSPAFANNHHIPIEYTCKGKNVSIPLSWSKVPRGTKSFVLIMEDPDTPKGVRYHWGLYNIPAKKHRLRVGQALEGPDEHYAMNSWGKAEYQGPCPPQGTHRYTIKLYALDTRLRFFEKEVSIEQIEDAMIGHIIADAKLRGVVSHKH
ncbi:MAG: YbhB/YbcL family Raf kinase inhibitor-like protein [Gammaproteobacteria bacterium]|nr:YbhB/YbcL family Raf kinase inhibitor-like protein [Gammaproteobacteria bacterium]MCH9716236.1 YbhB/YbcL family Raf kinase inhibitor-like protein [Gammaproteobacteria bacterium]MCH9744404.1 YbhB/YbcL family Raf kinase inhibitor-like protein [Gammaproteobacteria bacterium]